MWSSSQGKSTTPEFAVVDESWELTDPNPDIHALFVAFNRDFFFSALGAAEVKWSKRMTSCAGICSFSPRGGSCVISLSEPLLKLRPRKDLVETLLHEMIHAYLFLYDGRQDREAHGPLFLHHMNRINTLTGASISVYHSFHNEVNHFQTHWWRCTGPCKERKPFFGFVKRSMNRAPGPNDRWWQSHQQGCNGNFIKIREPEPKAKPVPTKDKRLNVPGTINPGGKNRQPMHNPGLVASKFEDQLDITNRTKISNYFTVKGIPSKESTETGIPCSSGSLNLNPTPFKLEETENVTNSQVNLSSCRPESAASAAAAAAIARSNHGFINREEVEDCEVLFERVVHVESSLPQSQSPTKSVICDKCKKSILMWDMDTHMDYHVAKDLQRELNGMPAPAPAGTASLTAKKSPTKLQELKRKTGGGSGGGEKRRMTGMNMFDSYFTQN